MIKVISIMDGVPLGGGGKIKAIYHRLNAFGDMDGYAPVLLTMDHSAGQKLDFEQLKTEGKLSPRATHVSLPELCGLEAVKREVPRFSAFADFDEVTVQGGRKRFLRSGSPVMEDFTRQTPIGQVINRTMHQPGSAVSYTLIDGYVFQKIVRSENGIAEVTDFAECRPVRWQKLDRGKFVTGRNLITGATFGTPKQLSRSLLQMVDLQGAVTFIDGIMTAYLADAVRSPRALFLHTEHRGAGGAVMPKFRTLIEGFQGEAIVTATDVHKNEIEGDLSPAAGIRVIPHFCQTGPMPRQQRRDIVTISRLDLAGKPIDACIRAFASIMDEFPGLDYLIHGDGGGRQQLADLIAQLGCGERVRLMGYTRQPLAVFNGALASLYPTMSEGFGLSILESLSAGCPVISYDVKYGPQEMIRPGVNGYLVAPGDIGGIADAIRKVLRDPEGHSRGCAEGLERYSREAYLRNYHELVLSMVGQAPSAAETAARPSALRQVQPHGV